MAFPMKDKCEECGKSPCKCKGKGKPFGKKKKKGGLPFFAKKSAKLGSAKEQLSALGA